MRSFRKYKILLVFLLAFVLIIGFSFEAEAAEEEYVWGDSEVLGLYIKYYYYFTYDPDILYMTDPEAMVKALGDKYSEYYTADEMKILLSSVEGDDIGIGIQYYFNDDGQMQVVGVIPDSPAEAAGIKVGDIIVAVDNTSIVGKTEVEAKSLLIPFWGRRINVTVERNGTKQSFDIVMDYFHVPSTTYEMLEEGIGYLRIVSFDNYLIDEIEKNVADLQAQGAKSLVLDLRGCPGGIVDVLVEALDLFLPEGVAIYIRQGNYQNYYFEVDNEYYDLPIVILVDGGSASAAELFTGSMQDAHQTTIIGTKTYGKGIMQSIYYLPSGAGVKLTTAQVFTRGYQNIQAMQGIYPDINISNMEKQLEIAICLCREAITKNTVSLSIDDKGILSSYGKAQMPVAPIIKGGSTYVPLRAIASAMGAWVNWQDGKAYVYTIGKQITINTRNNTIEINGETAVATSINQAGSILVPLRFFGEYLGYTVNWYGESKSIVIKN